MIRRLADVLVFDVLGLEAGTRWGEALHFFFYDSMKIFLLLFLVCLAMGVVNAYFPIERLREYLTTRRLYGFQYLFASVFGAITPFCSCSSIPLFIGFVKGGIPLGVTFAFLITSPLVNEVAVAMFWGRSACGRRLFTWSAESCWACWEGSCWGVFRWSVIWHRGCARCPLCLKARRRVGRKKSIFPSKTSDDRRGCLERGAAGMDLCPDRDRGRSGDARFCSRGIFERYMSSENVWAVPLSVLCAVPLYANAAGIVPIVQVLVAKGIPLGTAIAFIMAVVGLSLPEAILLKKVMTWRLVGIFFGVVSLFIVLSGYLFNLLL